MVSQSVIHSPVVQWAMKQKVVHVLIGRSTRSPGAASDRRKAWKYLEVGWQDRFYMKIMKQ